MAENRGPELAAITATFLVLSVISVIFRCYTMGFLLKRFFIEDYLAVVSVVVFIAYSTFVFLGVSHGLGGHVYDVPLDEHPKALLWKWAGQVAYVLEAALVKIVVALFLLRICSRQKWQRIVLWSFIVVTILFNSFYLVLAIIQCRPVEFYWFRYDPNPPVTGSCNHKALAIVPTYISLLLNVITDISLAVLPATVVWQAQMHRRMKISVSLVLALGSLASVATIARIPYAKQLLSNPDYLYNFTDLANWSTIEIGIAITASSLATLKPLFRTLKVLASTHGNSRSGATGGNTHKRITAHGMGSMSRPYAKRPPQPRQSGFGPLSSHSVFSGHSSKLDSTVGEKTLMDNTQFEREDNSPFEREDNSPFERVNNSPFEREGNSEFEREDHSEFEREDHSKYGRELTTLKKPSADDMV